VSPSNAYLWHYRLLTLQQIVLLCCVVHLGFDRWSCTPCGARTPSLQYCRKGIHVSAHTPLGIPARYALDIRSAEQEAFLTTGPRPCQRAAGKSKSVLAPMLRHTVVPKSRGQVRQTPAQVGLLNYSTITPLGQVSDGVSWRVEMA